MMRFTRKLGLAETFKVIRDIIPRRGVWLELAKSQNAFNREKKGEKDLGGFPGGGREGERRTWERVIRQCFRPRK